MACQQRTQQSWQIFVCYSNTKNISFTIAVVIIMVIISIMKKDKPENISIKVTYTEHYFVLVYYYLLIKWFCLSYRQHHQTVNSQW